MREKTMVEHCAQLIKEHLNGPDGFEYTDLEKLIQQRLPQYKPSSASPALSSLRLVGVVRDAGDGGPIVRNIYVRDLTTRDMKKIREHSSSGKRREPELKGGAMIAIALGDNRTELVSVQQARAIFASLKPLFGD